MIVAIGPPLSERRRAFALGGREDQGSTRALRARWPLSKSARQAL